MRAGNAACNLSAVASAVLGHGNSIAGTHSIFDSVWKDLRPKCPVALQAVILTLSRQRQIGRAMRVVALFTRPLYKIQNMVLQGDAKIRPMPVVSGSLGRCRRQSSRHRCAGCETIACARRAMSDRHEVQRTLQRQRNICAPQFYGGVRCAAEAE